MAKWTCQFNQEEACLTSLTTGKLLQHLQAIFLLQLEQRASSDKTLLLLLRACKRDKPTM